MSNTDLQIQKILDFILDLAGEEAIRNSEYYSFLEAKKLLLEYFNVKTSENERE